MKVTHVITGHELRGAERFAADLIRALNASGVEQNVITLKPPSARALEYEAPTQSIRDSRNAIARVIDLRRRLTTSGPHVVQAHGGDPLRHVVLADPRARYPLVYRRIGEASKRIRKRPRRELYGLMFRRADRVIALTQFLASETQEVFNVPPQKIVVIPNAIDTERIRPHRSIQDVRAELGIETHCVLLLSVGALTWEKDPLLQVDIAAEILDREPNAYYLMVGDGPLHEEVRARHERLLPPNRSRLLGSRDDVADLMNAADILLLTSATEGAPGVAIEAGFADLPVVAFDRGSVGELVVDGVSGILAPSGDRASLVESVVKLIEDPELRSRLARGNKEHVEGFTIDRVAPQYLSLYQTLAEPHGAGSR